MSTHPTPEEKHKCLEVRVKYMLDFVVAMKEQGISPPLIEHFIDQDREFIYDFCERIEMKPDSYIDLYNEGIR